MNKKIDGRILTALIFIAVGLIFFFGLSGYTFISYTCWGISLAILFYWLMKCIRPKYPKLEKILNKTASYGIILFCMIFAITEGALVYGAAASEPADEPIESEYVIVLGAGIVGTEPSQSLRYRLNTALEYLNEKPNAMCIVSGGQAGDEEISEAECMCLWLVNEGISPDRIIKEEASENTRENIENSIAIIENITDVKPETVTIVTEGFHMLRASLIAKNMGVQPVSVPARTELPILSVNHYIREAFALWKYLVLG